MLLSAAENRSFTFLTIVHLIITAARRIDNDCHLDNREKLEACADRETETLLVLFAPFPQKETTAGRHENNSIHN